jgi:hypothetical protein
VSDGNDGRDDAGVVDADRTADALAGVVDLFGALTRGELDRACAELAARQGGTVVADADVDAAVRTYHLVAVGPGSDVVAPDGSAAPLGPDGEWLVVGPVAFPSLPAGAEDLPHVLDVDRRAVDRGAAVDAVETRLRRDAARAVVDDDAARMRRLLDVTYDLEAWATADVADVRTRLDDALAALDADDEDGGGDAVDADDGS